MNNSRRNFIKQAGMGLSAAAMLSQFEGLNRVQAQTASDYKALVCIFLFGGNDGNNTVIPHTNYAAYNAVRGTSTGLNIPQSQLLKISVPSHGADYGLHPSLVELQTLYQQRKLAVLCNTGTLVQPLTRTSFLNNAPRPEHLFSHSDQQVQWQSSMNSTTQSSSGWGARTVEATAGLNGTNTFPPMLSVAGEVLYGIGKKTRTFVPGVPLFGFPADVTRHQRYKSLRSILTYDLDSTLLKASSGISSAAIDNNNTYSVAMGGNTVATAFPSTSLGNQLKQIATTIKARNAIGNPTEFSITFLQTTQNQLVKALPIHVQHTVAVDVYWHVIAASFTQLLHPHILLGKQTQKRRFSQIAETQHFNTT